MQASALNRRETLGGLAALLGASTLPADVLAKAAKADVRLPAPIQSLASAYADTLMPRTDTPGAVDAGVPRLFAALLADWASPQTRASVLEALQKIDGAAGTGGFAAKSAAQRRAMLAPYDQANFADTGYRRLRELMLVLYYSSEPGATVELRYEHAPGAFEPSVPITAQTRAWAGAGYI
ncbi:gluconate 2-dehydrogenase subunit 3 family protein [Novosphingobium taihuense]|uniref:Gluconate 2-dehydrogenase subunit 3-like protein n=1 Tax=Novosphingobium taihuense TaxID=260085 RepID=A0A7W7A7Z0_9SPHN|nr:gluconate 2-dehydrogenase subunit 3 family protein [Novosphingobium taihuense]MBB4611946.1 hypothetical protein [Novosphingobium taihuense]TWH88701.1 gluconate 2-dehydrogenase subunit 3-like protein [Novosphingobium taihuense]